MKQFTDEAELMLDFIHRSPSAFHAVDNVAAMLTEAGFEELCLCKPWTIAQGGRYFVRRNQSALFAFTLGTADAADAGFRFVTAHSDSPGFRIKPRPEMLTDGRLLRLNTEVYGGPILMTWLDRPLSVAGRVVTRSADPLRPRRTLVDLQRPLGVIPSLAIHFNRAVNEGVALNRQTDMPLLVAAVDRGFADDDTLLRLVADKAGVAPDEVLDCDLYLYDTERGTIFGTGSDLVLSPKLDDLSMVFAGTRALVQTAQAGNYQMLCIFDNEEVGSGTKQGAASPVLRHILERISQHLGHTPEQHQRMLYNSFMVSADQAHALHPNQPSMHDPVLHPVVNGGPVIKINANQKYMTDADSSAVFSSICKEAGVPCQMFVNRSDMAGGSTLGNILTSQIDIRGVDMGNPMIGMHSARETGGVLDQLYATRAFARFFATR